MHFLCLSSGFLSPDPPHPVPFVSLTFVNETPGPGTPANPETCFAKPGGGVSQHRGPIRTQGLLPGFIHCLGSHS